MPGKEQIYIAIDLKSFYASVECVDRGLDPLSTHLVVADVSRTDKTICLAVSPSLKAYGISGRARLFEVEQRVKEVNASRKSQAPGQALAGECHDAVKLEGSPHLAVGYITAPPRMARYMERSAEIYGIYLKYIAPEDIHVYSIDEVFMDVSCYLEIYKMSARELAKAIIQDVLQTTGITAVAGIGTNLYLCKVALDIGAKRTLPDQDGARIAELDEMSYRRQFWNHRPLTDFWRVGRGYAKKLEEHGMNTMFDVARCSIGKAEDYYNEDLLYKLFGVNAELLIDHAWGWEPCTIAEIKAYQPASRNISSSQVLARPYDFHKAKLVVQEMADALALDLVDRGLVASQVALTIGYDIENLDRSGSGSSYGGQVETDHYGRKMPKHVHGTESLDTWTSSSRLVTDAVMEIYGRITNPHLLIRRICVAASRVMDEKSAVAKGSWEQMDLFTDYKALEERRAKEAAALERERKLQEAVLAIKKRYGKNAILKGMSLQEGATAMERNRQIGGHKA